MRRTGRVWSLRIRFRSPSAYPCRHHDQPAAEVLRLLCVLLRSDGRVLEKDHLLRTLWPDTFVEEANLSNLIALLRKLLGDSPSRAQYIQTVSKVGYRFAAAVNVARQSSFSAHHPQPVHMGSDMGAPRVGEGFWIAVLPFRYLAPHSAEIAHLAVEFSEGIITGLSRFSYLRVVAFSSMKRYSDPAIELRAVGEQLGARYVVEGSLRMHNGKLRISVRLVDSVSGVHLWAETYDHAFDPERLFELHDELVPRIVSTMADTYGFLPRAISEELRSKCLSDLTPHETVLRCFGYYARMTPDEHLEMRACLESALNQAPNNADVASMLACIYMDEFSLGYNPQPNPLERALQCALRATISAPANALAYYAVASARFFRQEFSAFRIAAERAIALNPMNGSTLAGLGLQIAAAGDWKRGLQVAQRAIDLNPNHPGWYWFVFAYDAYRRRDYHEALNIASRINMPGFIYLDLLFAAIYGQCGRTDDARYSLQKLLGLRPDFALEAGQLIGTWFYREQVEHLVDGLRKAGLHIPKLTRD